MMKKRVYIVLLALFSFFVSETAAQQGFVSIGWQGAEAAGDTKDFISERSYEGFNFKVERFLFWGFALGLEAGFNHLYQDAGLQSVQIDNTTYTGSTFKYFDAAPLLLTGRIYLGARNPKSIFSPYVGVGVGGYYIQERMEVGSFLFQNDGWTYGFAPQAGLMIRLDKQLWLYGEASYHKAFERGEILENTWYTGTVGFRIGF